ncbi:MAG: alpha/beta fold hydrolase [Sphingomicrobium sp.]
MLSKLPTMMRMGGFVLLFLACSLTDAGAATARVDSWGSLKPGTEAVGFRTIFVHDKSRPWRQTRSYGAPFRPDLEGRPLQINLWYPAVAHSGKAMLYGDYVHQTTPPNFKTLGDLAGRRSGEALGDFPKAVLASLLADPVAARSLATPKHHKYPLVLLVGGLGADINANFVLAEYLASHRYVVASISLLGRDERQPDQSRSSQSIEANVRDLEFATPLICATANANCAKLVVAGHSLGAVIATLFANRNANVSAAIGLDGTYGFKGSGEVLTKAFGYGPREMRAVLLDLRRAEGSQSAELDLSPILAFSHSDLTVATLSNIHHSDFTSFAIMADRYGIPADRQYDGTGWTRGTGRIGYENAARIVLAFLNTHLAGASDTLTDFSLSNIPGATFRQVASAPAIPSPSEAIQIGTQQGLPALQSLIKNACRALPPGSCIDQQLFNSSGYSALSTDPAGSLILFEIVVWAHPQSANAQDSLADCYLATNRKADARRASARTIELAPTDPDLDDHQRREIMDAAKLRIQALDRG